MSRSVLDLLVEHISAYDPKSPQVGLQILVSDFLTSRCEGVRTIEFEFNQYLFLVPEGVVSVFYQTPEWNMLVLNAGDILEARLDEQGWNEVSHSTSSGVVEGTGGKSTLGALVGGVLLGPLGVVTGSVVGGSGAKATMHESVSQTVGDVRRNVVSIITSVWDCPTLQFDFLSNEGAMQAYGLIQSIANRGRSTLGQTNSKYLSGYMFKGRGVTNAIVDSLSTELLGGGSDFHGSGHDQAHAGKASQQEDDSELSADQHYDIGSALLEVDEIDYVKELKLMEEASISGNEYVYPDLPDQSEAIKHLVAAARVGHAEAAKLLVSSCRSDDPTQCDDWWTMYFGSLSRIDKQDAENISMAFKYLQDCALFDLEVKNLSVLNDLFSELLSWTPLIVRSQIGPDSEIAYAALEYLATCIELEKLPEFEAETKVVVRAASNWTIDERLEYESRSGRTLDFISL